MISTDHCPFWFEGGKDGRTPGKELGRDNFAAIPNGCPGIEDRMMVLYTHGVRGGKFSINRWVELCCTNPAKLFGVYPQKGTIAPGADADIVMWDPDQTLHDQRGQAAPAHRLQSVRGHGSDRHAERGAVARARAGAGWPVEGRAGRRQVRQAQALRRLNDHVLQIVMPLLGSPAL